jgi:alkanesulfonate monooxygenase SsuD/methylene tetrahydromethanopterin reductase-like flavin-dependent oxidoreductase (luciferase family)
VEAGVKFGIFDHVDASGLPQADHYEMRLALVAAMDGMNFHSYHVAEHHGTSLGLAPSPSVYLAAVAQRTQRLRFGPLVYVAALHHPMRLAEEICMLDQMSRGRLEIGIGKGAVWIEQHILGVDPASVPRRYAEARDALLAALGNETVTFKGEFYSFENFPMVLRPYQQPRPPLWYGIGNPDSAVWAAANDVNVVSLQPASVAARCLSRYRQEWSALGKATADLPFLGIARHVVVGNTDEQARRVARAAYPRWRAAFAELWNRSSVPFPLEHAFPLDWDGFEARGAAVAGTPQTVHDFIARQAGEAGANFFLCHMIFGAMRYDEALQSLTLFSREVAPALDTP